MDLTLWVDTALMVVGWLRPRAAQQERSIGFRCARNAPPYGLRRAPLQPTLLSRRADKPRRRQTKRNKELDNLETRTFPESTFFLKRPTRVLQKAANFTCYQQ